MERGKERRRDAEHSEVSTLEYGPNRTRTHFNIPKNSMEPCGRDSLGIQMESCPSPSLNAKQLTIINTSRSATGVLIRRRNIAKAPIWDKSAAQISTSDKLGVVAFPLALQRRP